MNIYDDGAVHKNNHIAHCQPDIRNNLRSMISAVKTENKRMKSIHVFFSADIVLGITIFLVSALVAAATAFVCYYRARRRVSATQTYIPTDVMKHIDVR